MKNKCIFLTLIVSLIVSFSCGNKSEKKNQISSIVNKSVYQIEIRGRNDFLAKIDVFKLNRDKSRKKYKFDVKLSSKSNSVFDTIILGNSLELFYPELMSVLMKVPYEEPRSINFEYENNKFIEIDPFNGSKIDTFTLSKYLKHVQIKENFKIDLDKKGFYMLPTYNSESPEAADGKLALEKCLKSILLLKFEDKEFKMDKKIFASWLHLDSAMNVEIETDPIQRYLQDIARQIEIPLPQILELYENTDTTSLTEIKFLRLNIRNLINEIIQLIPKGKNFNVELKMEERGIPKGILAGHLDFVEISISEQKLWLFNGGSLLLETSVVTGNKKRGRSTPPGNYSILYKARNKWLRGRDYESFVSYWMPFYGGYGLHDANWRRRFGGSIYESSGSHGCVNIPPKLAPIVYNNVKVGTPVIIW